MRRPAFLAAAIGALVIVVTSALFVLAGSDGAEDGGGVVVIAVAFEAGEPFEPTSTRITEGSSVSLRVTSSAPDELHLHGYDLSAELEPGEEIVIDFIADQTGRFEFELEDSETTLGVIEVRPK